MGLTIFLILAMYVVLKTAFVAVNGSTKINFQVSKFAQRLALCVGTVLVQLTTF